MTPVLVRPATPADFPALRQVFHTAVHQNAAAFYTPAQLAAWAPDHHDAAAWAERMTALRPFVAVLDGRPVGFADLQDDGYVDCFFVAGGYAGRGVGTALMHRLHEEATARGLTTMWANVSRAAEGFFAAHGFVVERRQIVAVRGRRLRNARMRKRLG